MYFTSSAKILGEGDLPRGPKALEQWSQSHHLFVRSAMSNLTALIPLIGTVIDCFVWITNFR